jgi:hypothetical protein
MGITLDGTDLDVMFGQFFALILVCLSDERRYIGMNAIRWWSGCGSVIEHGKELDHFSFA